MISYAQGWRRRFVQGGGRGLGDINADLTAYFKANPYSNTTGGPSPTSITSWACSNPSLSTVMQAAVNSRNPGQIWEADIQQAIQNQIANATSAFATSSLHCAALVDPRTVDASWTPDLTSLASQPNYALNTPPPGATVLVLGGTSLPPSQENMGYTVVTTAPPGAAPGQPAPGSSGSTPSNNIATGGGGSSQQQQQQQQQQSNTGNGTAGGTPNGDSNATPPPAADNTWMLWVGGAAVLGIVLMMSHK